MSVGYYNGTREVEDAMAVVSKWISGNRNIRVVYHNGTAVDADVEKGVIRIPRMACAAGVSVEALMLVRGRNYHEAGHIKWSRDVRKADYPKGARFSIWNALEDRRMEAKVADENAGTGSVFKWCSEYYNREIAGKVVSGEVKAALWEALVAMSFQSEGFSVAWPLTPKARKYFDAGYDLFCEWRKCGDAKDTLELAGRLYDLLKVANEDFNKEQEPEQGGESKDGEKKDKSEKGEKKDKSDKSEKGEKDEEGSSAAGDMDEEEGEEDEDGEGSEGEGSGDGEEDEDGEEGKGSAGSDDDFENEGEKDGDGDSEGGEEGDEGEGAGEGSEGSDGDGSAEGEGDADGESKDGGTNTGDVTPGKSEYKPEDKEVEDGDAARSQAGTSLEEEVDGISQEQAISEALAKLLGDLDPAGVEYLSRRDLDVHEVPETDDSDKAEYKEQRDGIAAAVTGLTGALVQALRSMMRCRRKPYQRQGRIDKKRLVSIAKGLSKEVFFRKQEGIDLDVAVEITIDESGSMFGIVEDTRAVAMAVGEALDAIGVPFEITGFTTTEGGGRLEDGFDRTNPILYRHYKTFNEGFGAVRHRLVHSAALKHNVDGEVVEYACFRLAQRQEKRKVVLSLSDGEPCAGHGNDGKMAKNLKKVCERARKAGIEVYGFGIGTLAPKGLYGDKWFVLLDRNEGMGAEFVRSFARIVTEGKVRL